MRKLIIKTVIITLMVMAVISMVITGICAIFSPKTIGNISNTIGDYKTASWAYERQYLLDGSEESFENMNYYYVKYSENLIERGKYEKAAKVCLKDFSCEKGLTVQTYSIIKSKFLEKLSSAKETEMEIIQNCIEKINTKI